MQMLARTAASRGGRVLELGFGLGIAAREIERVGVKEHWIVECNSGVFSTLLDWSVNQPAVVIPLQSLAEEVCPSLPSASAISRAGESCSSLMELMSGRRSSQT